jgi:hypothetical protein
MLGAARVRGDRDHPPVLRGRRISALDWCVPATWVAPKSGTGADARHSRTQACSSPGDPAAARQPAARSVARPGIRRGLAVVSSVLRGRAQGAAGIEVHPEALDNVDYEA